MDGLEVSLYNLYQGNMMLCAKKGIGVKECEKTIIETIKKIQEKTKKVCGEDKACNKRGLEWHIDNEEIMKLQEKLLLTYT